MFSWRSNTTHCPRAPARWRGYRARAIPRGVRQWGKLAHLLHPEHRAARTKDEREWTVFLELKAQHAAVKCLRAIGLRGMGECHHIVVAEHDWLLLIADA